jgi:hypothetical protein
MQFGVCTNNKGYPASLEIGKLYPVIPDGDAAKHGYVRVIDESGEDYGYSADRFLMLQVSESQAKALRERLGPWVRRPNKAQQPTVASRRRLNA